MTNTIIKTSNVTDFIKFIAELSPAYVIDKQGYVCSRKGENDRILIGDKPIALYQESLPNDAHILNPFSEGIIENPATRWLYKSLRMALTATAMCTASDIVQLALDDKNKKKHVGRIAPAVINIASLLNKKTIDEKTLDEMAMIRTAALKNDGSGSFLMSVLYLKKQISARFDLPIVTEGSDFSDMPNTIRKGTLDVVQTVLTAMFDVKTSDELVKFDATAPEHAIPKISAYTSCLFKVYRQINKILGGLSDDSRAVDLEDFSTHISLLSEYSLNAKSAVTVSVAPVVNSVTQIPSSMAVAPGLPQGQSSMGIQTTVIPGPMYLDGTPSTGTPVTMSPRTYYGAPIPGMVETNNFSNINNGLFPNSQPMNNFQHQNMNPVQPIVNNQLLNVPDSYNYGVGNGRTSDMYRL